MLFGVLHEQHNVAAEKSRLADNHQQRRSTDASRYDETDVSCPLAVPFANASWFAVLHG
jgi:hypothetical protein